MEASDKKVIFVPVGGERLRGGGASHVSWNSSRNTALHIVILMHESDGQSMCASRLAIFDPAGHGNKSYRRPAIFLSILFLGNCNSRRLDFPGDNDDESRARGIECRGDK